MRAVAPGRYAWRGATRTLWLLVAVLLASVAWQILSVPSPNWLALLPVVILPLAALLAGVLISFLLRALAALPAGFRLALIVAGGLFALLLLGSAPLGVALLLGIGVFGGALLGAGIGALTGAGRAQHTSVQRAVAAAGIVVGGAIAVTAAGWLWWDGPDGPPVVNAALVPGARVPAPLEVEDPALPGPYDVVFLSYGSGRDRHRPEYGERATLRTAAVDGRPFVERWSGPAGWARTRYWGFDASALPLQARVWYPSGAGPFPLVLVVHGNHIAEDYSDPGYEYLGRLLASRGFIVASVDQNFLNSSGADLLGIPSPGLKEENDARGWLLLEHLRLWREWNGTDGHPFRGKVDLERIALIGHSRGGDAVVIAAVFNGLAHYPDDARVHFDYGFGIRSLIAIAPVDGQYRPAGVDTQPEAVNYFVLHGSYDGDVQSYHGSRVLQRVRLGDDAERFKAGLYIHGANHGQFNTGWGRADAGFGLRNRLLNQRPIMPAAAQRRVAEVYVGAFLEATLHDRHAYRPLFRDHRAAAGWLPSAVYLHQYQDNATDLLCTYEEDLDVTTTTWPGGRIEAHGLTDWKIRQIGIKWGTLDTRAVILGWNREQTSEDPAAGEPAAYTIRLPDEPRIASGADSVLTFQLADANAAPSPPLGAAPGAPPASVSRTDAERGHGREPIDLTIELVDRAGTRARLPLAHVALLQPQIEAAVAKAAWLTNVPRSEVVFQVFEFPLADFVAVAPGFAPTELAQIRFVFDRSAQGVVVLDDVGVRQPRVERPIEGR